jgi:dCTP deaminase
MILCNLGIHRALDQGRLIIEPEPVPRLPTADQECPYDTHSVDLRLGSPITIPIKGPYNFDLTNPGLAGFLSRNAEHIDLAERGSYSLKPEKFVLGITRERVALPILPRRRTCLAARIEGKSSRARCGLLVHFTAPTVHPGWDGQLALEIINFGPVAFVLTYEMFIAQLIVEEVSGLPVQNPSQFQRQSRPTGSR